MASASSGLAASKAVLGLLIERPGCGFDLERRLEERFPSAQFAYSTAYNALRRMAKEGLVRAVETESAKGAPSGAADSADADAEANGKVANADAAATTSRGEATYEATEKGRKQFLAWIREPSRLPMLREELHAKTALSSPRDLPRLIEMLLYEEQACAYKIEQLRAQTVATRPSGSKPLAQREWSELMALAVSHGEAAYWTGRIAQLSALRRYLTELQDEAQRRTIAEDRLRMQRKGRAA